MQDDTADTDTDWQPELAGEIARKTQLLIQSIRVVCDTVEDQIDTLLRLAG